MSQTLHVEVLRVSQEGPSSKVAAGKKQKPETRWLDDEQVVAAAVPTQMKKVFKAAVAALSDADGASASRGGKNEKRKRTDSAKMAPMMERFLIKRQRRADVTS